MDRNKPENQAKESDPLRAARRIWPGRRDGVKPAKEDEASLEAHCRIDCQRQFESDRGGRAANVWREAQLRSSGSGRLTRSTMCQRDTPGSHTRFGRHGDPCKLSETLPSRTLQKKA